MLSTIVLFSSSRRSGNTGQLVDRIARELGIQVVDLADQRISQYDYEHRNRKDDFEPLMKRLLAHEQIIFATPIYWYAVSPAMKIFLDRLSDYLELPELLPEGRRLRGKNAYVVCTSSSNTAACCIPTQALGDLDRIAPRPRPRTHRWAGPPRRRSA